MRRPAPPLSRPLSLLLCVLALLLVGVPPAKGDAGRNGGIIILPCATHSCSWGEKVRASFAFQAGDDMVFELDPSLASVVLIAETGAGAMPIGSVSGRILTVLSADIRRLKASGLDDLRLRVMDRNLLGYDLEFVVEPSGAVTVRLY